MQAQQTTIQDALLLTPKVFGDQRGFFLESWNKGRLKELGIGAEFVQDNHSRSSKGVLRGLHYQLKNPQGKLVRVVSGKVLDVIVDLRQTSPTFGQHYTVELSGENHRQLWAPPGVAHGFVVLSDTVDFLYKTTGYYAPEDEHTIIWNDGDLQIDWQLGDLEPQLSAKDKQGVVFQAAKYYK